MRDWRYDFGMEEDLVKSCNRLLMTLHTIGLTPKTSHSSGVGYTWRLEYCADSSNLCDCEGLHLIRGIKRLGF